MFFNYTTLKVCHYECRTDYDKQKDDTFFNNSEVRAVWDDENNCWWFSATDIVRAINDEPDYTKAGNYWRWLKRKLKQEGVQFVSTTHKLKIVAADTYRL